MSRKASAKAQEALYYGSYNFSDFLTCTPHDKRVMSCFVTPVAFPVVDSVTGSGVKSSLQKINKNSVYADKKNPHPLPTLFFLLPTLIGKSKDPGEDFFHFTVLILNVMRS